MWVVNWRSYFMKNGFVQYLIVFSQSMRKYWIFNILLIWAALWILNSYTQSTFDHCSMNYTFAFFVVQWKLHNNSIADLGCVQLYYYYCKQYDLNLLTLVSIFVNTNLYCFALFSPTTHWLSSITSSRWLIPYLFTFQWCNIIIFYGINTGTN